jgi:peptidoglycan/LPS O-acetylase OafA/YrhL
LPSCLVTSYAALRRQGCWGKRILLLRLRIEHCTLLAGLFVRQAVEKRSSPALYLRGRVATFLWLYLLWYVVLYALKAATAAVNGEDTSLLKFLTIWVPDSHLWYLPFSIVATTIAVVLRPWRNSCAAGLTLLASALVAVGFWGVLGSVVFLQGAALYLPYLVGVLLGARRFSSGLAALTTHNVAALASLLIVIYVVIVLATPAIPPSSSTGPRTVAGIFFGVLGTATGTTALILAAVLGARANVRPLAYIGRHSLEIFLSHTLFTAATRVILLKLHVSQLLPHLVVGTMLGVCAPLALAYIARKVHARWFFELPQIFVAPKKNSHAGPA